METMSEKHSKVGCSTKRSSLFGLMREHPDLPVVPMVQTEVVAGDDYGRWIGRFGDAHIEEYYIGEERVYFRNNRDTEEVSELVSEICGYDVYEFMTDEETVAAYDAVPWIRAIIVNIDLP